MTILKMLTNKTLNRALLARQMLLSRTPMSPLKAVAKLAGLQAQLARPPFVALWSRLQDFKRDSLLELYHQRKLVRATMMRATIHTVSAKDYIAFRQTIQPALTSAMNSVFRNGSQIDQHAILAAAQRLFSERACTFAEIRDALSKEFPEVDERMMGYFARTSIPLVMAPDSSEFGFAGSRFMTAESWLNRGVDVQRRIEDLVLRYLAAFGPASVTDAQTWSYLTKLAPVFEKLRPRLVVFRDERKRELFDLRTAPRPEEDAPVPVRFLPAFDNILLAHADRSRIIADEYRPRVSLKNLQILPTFLVEGFVAGTWDVALQRRAAVLTISPFKPLTRVAKAELAAEGEDLLRFLAPDCARREVTVLAK